MSDSGDGRVTRIGALWGRFGSPESVGLRTLEDEALDMLFRFLAPLGVPFALIAALLEPADPRRT